MPKRRGQPNAETPCPLLFGPPILKFRSRPRRLCMREKTMPRSVLFIKAHALPALALAATGLALAAFVAPAAEGTPGLTAEQVKELQAKFVAERAAAEKDGLTRMFSPDW